MTPSADGNGETSMEDVVPAATATATKVKKSRAGKSPRNRGGRPPKAMPTARMAVPAAQPARKVPVAEKKQGIYRAALLLKLISEPSRVAIVQMLSEQGATNVTAICKGICQGQPATSHHLALLRHSGIVMPSRSGKSNYYSLSEQGKVLARVIEKLVVE